MVRPGLGRARVAALMVALVALPLPVQATSPPTAGETLPPPRVRITGATGVAATDLTPAPLIPPPLPSGERGRGEGGGCPNPGQVLQGPILSQGQAPPSLTPAPIQDGDRPLPINLPTALRLADAQPLVIAAAQASLRVAVAQLQRARVLWIPNFNAGFSYLGHVGGAAGTGGSEFVNTRDQLLLGGGLTAIFAVTDAIFAPLAIRQVVRARQFEVQAARNDALLAVAEAYFNVQQARGQLSGMQDAVAKSRQLAERIRGLKSDLTSPIELNRALTELADLERQAALMYQDWRVTSARLTRVLRLNPLTVVAPLEPPALQVTLIAPSETVDDLVPIGLTNRPELAAHQALVQETLVRLRAERLRPLIPSLLLSGNPVPVAPYGNLMFGAFYSDVNGRQNPWTGRIDPNVQVIWTLENFGFGNRARVREQQARNSQALVELFRVQDRVAEEVVEAHARVQSAVLRVARAETEVQQAQTTFAGNLQGISTTVRFGDRLMLVNRPLEAVDALRQVIRAYNNYFSSVGDYNRAQFQLYRAMGYPAGILACERTPGPVQPVDMSRPPQMAPVPPPRPCQGCPH